MIPNGAIGARFSSGGDVLYLTDVTGLGIYDVRNPASPQILAHLPLPRGCQDGAGSIHLVDVAEPSAPVIRATRPAVRGGLTIYDVRDLSCPPPLVAEEGGEELAWVTGQQHTFAYDLTDPVQPRLVLGGPGAPRFEHERLLTALGRRARAFGWPGVGAPVGFYVSAGSFWGAYLAPSDCPPLGPMGRNAGHLPSPTGELGRPASWGRGPVRSPSVPA